MAIQKQMDTQQRVRRAALILNLVLTFFYACRMAPAQGVIGHDKLSEAMLETLEHPTTVYVYSLEAQETQSIPNYFGWKLLGKASANTSATRTIIGQTLAKQTAPKDVSYCGFQPHHGVTVFSNSKRIDYVICFRCNQVLIYDSIGQYWNNGRLHTSDAVLEDKLNAVLKDQNVLQSQKYLAEKKRSTAKSKDRLQPKK